MAHLLSSVGEDVAPPFTSSLGTTVPALRCPSGLREGTPPPPTATAVFFQWGAVVKQLQREGEKIKVAITRDKEKQYLHVQCHVSSARNNFQA